MPEKTAGANLHDAPPAGPVRRKLGVGGFTLLELLAVIAIIAVLTGIVIGVGRRASEAGKVARAKAELAALSAALESYKRQYGDYPRTAVNAQFVQALVGRYGPTGARLATDGRAFVESAKFIFATPSDVATRVDPFSTSNAEILDPWEQPYRYAYRTQAPWTNPSFVLYSIGPDGRDTPALTNGFSDFTAEANLDNIHANRN